MEQIAIRYALVTGARAFMVLAWVLLFAYPPASTRDWIVTASLLLVMTVIVARPHEHSIPPR
jgi:hypothetical protein